MSLALTLSGGIPVDMLGPEVEAPPPLPGSHSSSLSSLSNPELQTKILAFVLSHKTSLQQARLAKQNIWDECWQLYRGQDDFSAKEDWQSKMVLPKAWSSVKQATNVISRLLNTAKEPFQIESTNPDDSENVIRAEKMTRLVKIFMESASWIEEFKTGLECSFIIGLAVYKAWWAMVPRQTLSTVLTPVVHPSSGELVSQKSVVQSTINEGKLFIRAVDPYNFFWLPGSKLNRWTGTLEVIRIPKWELLDLAHQGILPLEAVKALAPKRASTLLSRDLMRFGEQITPSTLPPGMEEVELLEYYGPIVIDEVIIERHAHIIIGNDTSVLVCQKNSLINRQAPYIGFSPLSLPFRTEGVGLIEMVRQIDKNISRIANYSVDTLAFRLMPLFEVNIDAYENPEDFDTGMTPGKIFRRNMTNAGIEGIKPLQMNDVSPSTQSVQGQLDRAHQEGALVTELQQSLPRFSGAQTATETQAIQSNQDSFFGSMAVDIESGSIEPLVRLAMDLIFQFIDTTTDPRVAQVLGVEAAVLGGIPKVDLMSMLTGDFNVKVTGITGQLMKAEALQQLVQFMNLIGQNPQHWLPYINQDALLRRILESFRPAIHDIENIIADPQTAAAKQAAMQLQEQHGALLQLLPQLQQMSADASAREHSQKLDAANLLMDSQKHTSGLDLAQSSHSHDQAMAESAQLISAAVAANQRRQMDLNSQTETQNSTPAAV